MPKPAKDVAASLKKKGFVPSNSDHIKYYLHVGGRRTVIRTKVSHGEKEISDNLLSLMARQLKLTRKQLMDLVDCPLSFSDYVKHLQAGNHIDGESPQGSK